MGKRKEKKTQFNKDLCDMLYDLAEFEKNIKRNLYKYNVYIRAAKILANHPVKITNGKEAKKLKGIGKKIADKIDELLKCGRIQKLEQIKNNKKFKAIQLLTGVSGIGPKKAKELVEKGVNTIEDLVIVRNELTHHQKIGLKYFYDFKKRIPRSEVANIELALVEQIAEVDKNFIVTICGSYRRGKQTSGDIDCLLTHPKYISTESNKITAKHEDLLQEVVEKLTICGLVIDIMALGPRKFMGVCRLYPVRPARRLDIRLTYMDEYFCGLLYFTGSDTFNKNIRAHALKKGFALNEYSLRPLGNTGVPGNPIPITCEQDIFDYIDYPYKAPEDRDL